MVRSWSWLYNDGAIWDFLGTNYIYIYSYQGEPKPLKRQVHRKKTEFYPKTQVFWISQFSISALSHKVFFDVKNQQCSHQHAASVLCRAWLETSLGNYSYISQMHAIQLSFDKNAPTNNVNFCIPGAYTTTWIVYLQKTFHDEPATRFLMKFVRAKTISGPKSPIMAAYGPEPKNPYFLRVPTG